MQRCLCAPSDDAAAAFRSDVLRCIPFVRTCSKCNTAYKLRHPWFVAATDFAPLALVPATYVIGTAAILRVAPMLGAPPVILFVGIATGLAVVSTLATAKASVRVNERTASPLERVLIGAGAALIIGPMIPSIRLIEAARTAAERA